jgi:hypothetical protein
MFMYARAYPVVVTATTLVIAMAVGRQRGRSSRNPLNDAAATANAGASGRV